MSKPRTSLLRRLEPLLWLGVGLLLLERYGPQLSAWTGIGPPGEVAPVLEVVTLDGHPWPSALPTGGAASTMSPASGEEVTSLPPVRVLTFWATWCTVCGWELPTLQALHEEWADSSEVAIVALSIDRGGADLVRAHALEEGFTFPIALADGRIRAGFGGIPGVPTTIVIDREGRIRHTMIGITGPGTLRRAVRRLVDEGGSPRAD